MGFMDHLGDAWDAVKDSGEAALGIAIDLAKIGDTSGTPVTITTNGKTKSYIIDKPPTIDTTRLQHHLDKKQASFSSEHGAVMGALKPVAQALSGLQWVTNKAQRAQSTWEILNSEEVAGPATGLGVSQLFSPSKWGKSWDLSAKVTPAQSFVKRFGETLPGQAMHTDEALGIADDTTWDELHSLGEKTLPNGKPNPDYSPAFSLATGSLDAVNLWVADPWVVTGKAAKAVRIDKNTLTKADDLAAAERRAGLPTYPWGKPTKAEPTEEMVTVYRGNHGPVDPEKIGEKGIRVTTDRSYAIEHGGSDHLYEMQIPKSALPNTTFSDALGDGPLPHAFLPKDKFLAAKPKLIVQPEGELAGATPRQVKIADEVQSFAAYSRGKSVPELMKHAAYKDSNNGAALASLMSAAHTDHQGVLIWLAAQNSTKAREALAAQRADLVTKIDNAQASLDGFVAPAVRYENSPSAYGARVNAQRQALAGRFSEEEKQAINDGLKTDRQALDMLDRALGRRDKQETYGQRLSPDDAGIAGSTSARPRVFAADKRRAARSSSFTVQTGVLGTPMRVLSPTERRPLGSFDFHNPDQVYEEFDRTTRRWSGIDFTPQERERFLTEVAQASDDGARQFLHQSFEEELFLRKATRYGLTVPEAKTVLEKMRATQRDHLMTERQYGFFINEDGSLMKVRRPFSETQLQNVGYGMDWDKIEKILKRNASKNADFRAAFGQKYDATVHGAEVLNDLWKFGVLFRGGYAQRNIVDGQLRLLSMLGASETVRQHIESAGFKRQMSAEMKYISDQDVARIDREVADLLKGDTTLTREQALKRVKAKSKAQIKAEAQDNVILNGAGRTKVGPYDVASEMGETGADFRQVYALLSPENRNLSSLIGTMASKKLEKLRGSGNWITLEGDHADWAASYLRVANQHLRVGEVPRMLLEGKTPEEVVRWLKRADQRQLRRRIMHGWDDEESLVKAADDTINHAVPAEMRAELAKRELNEDDIRAMWPVESTRPEINAEQIIHDLGGSEFFKELSSLRENYFHYVNTVPDFALSQHPMYRAFYRGRMRQELARMDPKLEGTITQAEQRLMEAQARTYARKQMLRYSFDASNKSNLGHFLRFLSPFYTAWEDVLKKYGRMVMDDPSLPAHYWQAWSAPNDASFVEVVDMGNHDVIPGSKSQISANEGILVQNKVLGRILGFASGGAYDGGIISKGAMNVALQGDPWFIPGAGPIGQASTQEIALALNKPEMGKWLQKSGILPFGVQNKGFHSLGYFEPAFVAALHPDSGTLSKLAVQIANEEEWKYQMGQRPDEPDAWEIRKKVWLASTLRAFTKALSPGSIQYQNPHQFYIDEYHRYLDETGTPAEVAAGKKKYPSFDQAEAAWRKKYGDDFYIFATSMTKNHANVRPSEQAYGEYKRVKDIVAKHPEFGDYIVGPNNVGTFDRNVYGFEQAKTLDPLSTTKMIGQYDSPLDAVHASMARKGWNEYRKMDDWIKAQMSIRGLDSMRVKEAADLREYKKNWIAWAHSDADNAPEWGEAWFNDFRDTDGNKTHRFLLTAQELTTDPRTKNRKDVKFMAEFLDMREWIRGQIAQRVKNGGPSSTLPDAVEQADGSLSFGQSSNADLAAYYHDYGDSLAERDVTFAAVWNRYLERDDLQDGV